MPYITVTASRGKKQKLRTTLHYEAGDLREVYITELVYGVLSAFETLFGVGSIPTKITIDEGE